MGKYEWSLGAKWKGKPPGGEDPTPPVGG